MKGLHHVGITVADLETAIDFYHGADGNALELVQVAYTRPEQRRAAIAAYLTQRTTREAVS